MHFSALGCGHYIPVTGLQRAQSSRFRPPQFKVSHISITLCSPVMGCVELRNMYQFMQECHWLIIGMIWGILVALVIDSKISREFCSV